MPNYRNGRNKQTNTSKKKKNTWEHGISKEHYCQNKKHRIEILVEKEIETKGEVHQYRYCMTEEGRENEKE